MLSLDDKQKFIVPLDLPALEGAKTVQQGIFRALLAK